MLSNDIVLREIASHTILTHLMNNQPSKKNTKEEKSYVNINQIKMWIIPQKTEYDDKFDINVSYFETLIQRALDEMLINGYIQFSLNDSTEEGDGRVFSLTEKGIMYIQENILNTSNE